MSRMSGILTDSLHASSVADAHGGQETAPNNLLVLYWPVELFLRVCGAAAVPRFSAGAEDPLHLTHVEG